MVVLRDLALFFSLLPFSFFELLNIFFNYSLCALMIVFPFVCFRCVGFLCDRQSILDLAPLITSVSVYVNNCFRVIVDFVPTVIDQLEINKQQFQGVGFCI